VSGSLTPTPDYQKEKEELRPFGELLERKDLVYHGVGVDLIALYGIAEHGLSSAADQEERLGYVNSNTTKELTKTGSDLVSVAETPVRKLPNVAFVTYIEGSAVSFAIDPANCSMVQPPDRGFYDEAFIKGAVMEDVVGVVINDDTADQRVADQPVVSRNVSPDVVAQKAQNVFNFLVRNLDPHLANYQEELDALAGELAHITSERLAATFGMISDADRNKIALVDEWLRDKITKALETKYGTEDLTVLDLVRRTFPSRRLYVNEHTDVTPYQEDVLFDTLALDGDPIGYTKWDGAPGNPSAAKMRQAWRRRSLRQDL